MKTKHVLCRFCMSPLRHTFVDLGMSPVANDYIRPQDKSIKEPLYELHVRVCSKCLLVQLPEIRREDEIFTDTYAYFSSYSSSWLAHSKTYVEMMIKRFKLTSGHQVIELASNDGYLLQYFHRNGIPVLGIEPCGNVADAAIAKGIPSLKKFFGVDTARELIKDSKKADVLIGNNVLAHVPNLNDFVGGMKLILKPDGIITMEFPHILKLIEKTQFDTIYHEHYSYFSFHTVVKIFAHFGLTLFDVEEIPTHGGSLRIYARHTANQKIPVTKSVTDLLKKEKRFKLDSLKGYKDFTKKVSKIKKETLAFLLKLHKQDKMVIGYGAPAKGNTFLNYCGVTADWIRYTVDKNPEKQNHFLPGVRIPVFDPHRIADTKPDYVFILPWNLKDEIMKEMSYIKKWGGKFIVAIPKVAVYT